MAQEATPPSGRVIVINGTSSSGKSTLARTLQERWPGPLLDAGLDRHLSMLPRRYLGPAWPEVYRYERAMDGTIAAVTLGPVGRLLYRAMHRGVTALATAGADVVVDHVLLDADSVSDLAIALDGVSATLVGVRLAYDLEVDTGNLSASEAADAILRWLADHAPPG
ncbi:MAG: phosphotransferase-like protein [Actinomycetota bacterium]